MVFFILIKNKILYCIQKYIKNEKNYMNSEKYMIY